MADTIRTGIVGATVTQGGSGWGANAHVPALHLLPDYTLQAVCTAHEDTAQASKEKFDAVHAFHDIDTMAQHPEIDLVVVCVRVPSHKRVRPTGHRRRRAAGGRVIQVMLGSRFNSMVDRNHEPIAGEASITCIILPAQQHMDTHARQPPRGETPPWLTPFAPASSARP